jgi:hypothetical protein
VSGDFRINILDDGTPESYLDKIREKYPDVKILLSDNYPKKSKQLKRICDPENLLMASKFPPNSGTKM